LARSEEKKGGKEKEKKRKKTPFRKAEGGKGGRTYRRKKVGWKEMS